MFSNFAWSEMLVIACVAIIVVGPKDLPAMLRQFGKTIGNIKRMASDFQRQFNDAIQDAELDELKNMTSTKGFAPLDDAKKSMEEFAKQVNAPVEADTTTQEVPPEAEAPESKPTAKPAAKKPAPKKAAPKKTAAANSTAAKTKTAKSTAAKTTTAKTAANGARKPAAKRAAPKKTASTTRRKTAAATKSTT